MTRGFAGRTANTRSVDSMLEIHRTDHTYSVGDSKPYFV
jgi:hypothetical protein